MVTVRVSDEQADEPVDAERWVALARRVLEAEGVSSGSELSMAFVAEPVMAELNQRFAGDEGATDVLAFPIDDVVLTPGAEVAAPHPADGPAVMVGDLVICPAVAARNAPTHAGTYDDEMALLVVHGILHLLGMDHAEAGEAADMQRREGELLHRLHSASATPSPS